jgi:hypothetical protein
MDPSERCLGVLIHVPNEAKRHRFAGLILRTGRMNSEKMDAWYRSSEDYRWQAF